MRDTNTATSESHRLTLGPVEKSLMSILLIAVVGVPAYLWQRAEAAADKQREVLASVDTRTQVMAQQMSMLTAQLADLPAINQRVSRLEVQSERNRQDIAELRSMRGLK